MTTFERGSVIEKYVNRHFWEVVGREDLVIVGDVSADWYNQVTSRACAFLGQAGILVAYREKLTDTEFVADRCQAMPLLVTGRRYATDDFLLRIPSFQVAADKPRVRQDELVVEFFVKTRYGQVYDWDCNYVCDMPLDPLAVDCEIRIHDPLIKHHNDDTWNLLHPKMPFDDDRSDIGMSLDPTRMLPTGVTAEDIETLVTQALFVIEGGFARLGITLISVDFTLGVNESGDLVIVDIVGWRLERQKGDDLDKNSELMKAFVSLLRVPKQVMVLWRETAGTEFPDIPTDSGVGVIEVTISSSGSSGKCLRRLQEIALQFPEGGGIIAIDGLTSNLGALLACNTDWPVIAVPSLGQSYPDLMSGIIDALQQHGIPLLVSPSIFLAISSVRRMLSQQSSAACCSVGRLAMEHDPHEH
jgi:hypothetical protein